MSIRATEDIPFSCPSGHFGNQTGRIPDRRRRHAVNLKMSKQMLDSENSLIHCKLCKKFANSGHGGESKHEYSNSVVTFVMCTQNTLPE